MKILCVAEKPSVAKKVAELLSSGQFRTRPTKNKYTKNYDFIYKYPNNQQANVTITSLLGHIMESEFHYEYRKWNNVEPVELFEAPIEKTIRNDMKDVADNLRSESRNSQKLMIWTDCDREGENIGAEVVDICKSNNTRLEILRARYSALQAKDIHRAIQNPVGIDMRQAIAVDARIELDLRIGAAFTRFQTLKLRGCFQELDNKVISYGSCQFPTLGFVVDRFLAIRNFRPEPFWYIAVTYEHPSLPPNSPSVSFSWARNHLFDRLCCTVLYEMCVVQPQAKVVEVKTKDVSKFKPLPLTTVEFQKGAVRCLRMTGDQIMKIAEKLYTQGLISYPRTETDQYPKDFDFITLVKKQTVDNQWGAYAQKLVDGAFCLPRQGRNNDNAHPPIHPTAYAPNLEHNDRRVFEYITRRFLGSCSDDAKGQETNVTIEIAEETFRASGLVILERNYLEVYTFDHWNGNHIPNFRLGETFIPTTIDMKDGKTSPPQLLKEEELIALMEKNEIGTDATIHEHIKKIIDREYVIKQGLYFTPSTLGIALVQGYDSIGLESSLSKPFLRREMEANMKRICSGQLQMMNVVQQCINQYRSMFLKANREVRKLLNALEDQFGHPAENAVDERHNHTVDDRRNHSVDDRRNHATDEGRNHIIDEWRKHTFNEGSNHATEGLNDRPLCRCGENSVRRVVGKEGVNKGRGFFGCAKRQDEPTRCDFFQWEDGEGVTNGSFSNVRNPGGSGSFYMLNDKRYEGNSNREDLNTNYRNHLDSQSSVNPRCHCGLITVVKTISKQDSPNRGKQFYSCPKESKRIQCNFFEILEDGDTNVTGGPSRPPRNETGSSSNRGIGDLKCFKCNKTGHFANKCPQNTSTSYTKRGYEPKRRGNLGTGSKSKTKRKKGGSDEDYSK